MGGRLSRGWQLTKVSWATLRSDRSLGAFPVLAAIAGLLLAAAFGAPAALLYGDDMTVPAIILAAIGIYAITFAAVFFNVALAGAAAQVLDGEDATVASGMAVARANIRAVAGWAAMVATVNIIVRALQDRAGPLGDILLGGLLVAWNLVTFLAVPVIAAEGTGPITTLKRAAHIFRARWGEQVTGQFAIGGLIFLIAILPALVVAGLGVLSGNVVAMAITITVAAVVIIIAMIVSAALSQIFAVALYRYAVGEGSTGRFTETHFAAAIRPRTGRMGLGRT
jgi:hypothetical protein